jgi:hypothetical protein
VQYCINTSIASTVMVFEMFVVSETKVIVFHEFMLLLVVLKFRGKYPLHVHCFMIDKKKCVWDFRLLQTLSS